MDMQDSEIIKLAFTSLYPKRKYPFRSRLVYSGRIKNYGGNVRLSGNYIEFKISKSWKDVSNEILVGLLQELMVKLFGGNRSTLNIDLYNHFVQNLHKSISKDRIDPSLRESFERVNERYFLNFVEIPNLVWGRTSTTKLGSYDYKSDTISISKIFMNADSELLDYVMYHEMLHKAHSFQVRGTRNLFHTSKFKKHEKLFEDAERLEKEISRLSSRFRTPRRKRKKKGLLQQILGS